MLRAKDEKYVTPTTIKRAHDAKRMNLRPSESGFHAVLMGDKRLRLDPPSMQFHWQQGLPGINCRASQQRYETALYPPRAGVVLGVSQYGNIRLADVVSDPTCQWNDPNDLIFYDQ